MDIGSEQAVQLTQLAQRHHVVLVLAFGSAVSGKIHAGSDLDIAVQLAQDSLSLEAYGQLRSDLQELFPARELDLAILNHADPLFMKHVLERAVLLYGKEPDFAALRLKAFHRYQDYRRFLAFEEQYVTALLGRFGHG